MEFVQLNIRVTEEMKKKLQIIAINECLTLQYLCVEYLTKGIESEEE